MSFTALSKESLIVKTEFFSVRKGEGQINKESHRNRTINDRNKEKNNIGIRPRNRSDLCCVSMT